MRQPSKLARRVRFPLPAPVPGKPGASNPSKNMNTPKHSIALAFTAAAYLIGAPLSAATCDKVAADVRAAIEANPSKVLIIVEDAMVTNETCACEIVKTALIASKANADLARQIVLTATNVAPNLTQLIAECAGECLPATAPLGRRARRS